MNLTPEMEKLIDQADFLRDERRDKVLLCVSGKPDHGMDYGTFMATEGGRKCPQCGKYAKKGTVGNLSFIAKIGNELAHISMYGHLPGHGCNSAHNVELCQPCPPLTPSRQEPADGQGLA